MGNCASCLGSSRRESLGEDEETQLMFDDANGMHYGSFGEQHTSGHEDPIEAQREIEALQRVVARTSDNLVDVFEIAPQDKAQVATIPTPYTFSGQEGRLARYQNLLSKLSTVEDGSGVRVDWIRQDDDIVELPKRVPPIKMDTGEPLVGNFADAAAAMR